MAVDWSFIRGLEGFITEANVPTNEDGTIAEKAGVTIGSGIDLGTKTEASLKRMGVSQSIIDKLKPYFGKKGAKAEAFRKENPLSLSEPEAIELTEAVKKDTLKKVKSWYNKNNTADNEWADLTDRQQSVITSVHFQYGAGNKDATPTFNKHVLKNDWAKTISELRDFKDKFETRRHKELQYLVDTVVDGKIGDNTEAAIENYIGLAQRDRASVMFNEQPMPDTQPDPNTGAMVPRQTSTAQRALESTVNPVASQEASDEFLNRLYEGLGKALNRQQSAPQEPEQAVTEPEEEEAEPESEFGAGEQAFFDRISSSRPGQGTGEEAEESPEEEAPDPRYEGFGSGERAMLEALSNRNETETTPLRATGTTETMPPVRVNQGREGIREDRDPTYGIF